MICYDLNWFMKLTKTLYIHLPKIGKINFFRLKTQVTLTNIYLLRQNLGTAHTKRQLFQFATPRTKLYLFCTWNFPLLTTLFMHSHGVSVYIPGSPVKRYTSFKTLIVAYSSSYIPLPIFPLHVSYLMEP